MSPLAFGTIMFEFAPRIPRTAARILLEVPFREPVAEVRWDRSQHVPDLSGAKRVTTLGQLHEFHVKRFEFMLVAFIRDHPSAMSKGAILRHHLTQ